MSENEFKEAVRKKAAGDKLDELTLQLAAREGIGYAKAFQRVAIMNPELMKEYRGEPAAAGR